MTNEENMLDEVNIGEPIGKSEYSDHASLQWDYIYNKVSLR